MLVTFLGLFSASLLPTITLLINGMTASGRSVYAIKKLDAEIRDAIDALLFIFGCTALTFAGLMALSFTPPFFLQKYPLLINQVLPRIEQGIVTASVILIIIKAGQIPAILRRALEMRKEIAINEALRKLKDQAPDGASVRASFTTHPDFGKTVTLDENED